MWPPIRFMNGMTGGNGSGHVGNPGGLWAPIMAPQQPMTNFNWQQYQMSAQPEYSKLMPYKEPNLWAAGIGSGLGLLGMVGSAFSGASGYNPAAFMKDEAQKFNKMGDEFSQMNNPFVKQARSNATANAFTGSQIANQNMNKQFAASGLGGRSSMGLAKQAQGQFYNQGLDQANQQANQAYAQSLNFAKDAYDRGMQYNQAWLEGEKQKRDAQMGRANAFGDIFGQFAGQGLGLLSGIFG